MLLLTVRYVLQSTVNCFVTWYESGPPYTLTNSGYLVFPDMSIFGGSQSCTRALKPPGTDTSSCLAMGSAFP
ncbi:hypothetical protein L798_15088 [Zootermopsis nevadensis]|uniref:Uncharacterized protein n=1 Tax=Zootermopsis nevadensis TaxID=136037 RepID=A0A067QNM3_ZOONE|nr:hypothetical protein L798_15088 [Zootermopsis nevadensis]